MLLRADWLQAQALQTPNERRNGRWRNPAAPPHRQRRICADAKLIVGIGQQQQIRLGRKLALHDQANRGRR